MTYEFRTIYIYLLYMVVAIMVIGIWTDLRWVTFTGMGLMVLYFLTVSLPYSRTSSAASTLPSVLLCP